MPAIITSEVEGAHWSNCQLGPGNTMFDMEIYIHKLLLASSYRVASPEEADLFYVPVYANKYMCHRAAISNRGYAKVDYKSAYVIAFDHIRNTTSWRANQGRDHIFSVTNGWSTRVLPWEVRTKAILLLSNGDASVGYNATRHIVIPPALTHHALQSGGRESDERSVLASFRGKIMRDKRYSNGIRQSWEQTYSGDSEVVIESIAGTSPSDLPLKSVFCLCPPGLTLWTPRPVESLFYGCIPVIVCDNLALPFHNLLDWSGFSIRIRSEQAAQVKSLLRNVSLAVIHRKQQLIRQVYRLFAFDPSYKHQAGNDMLTLLMLSLKQILISRANAREVWY